MRHHYAKVCDVEDFADRTFAERAQELRPHYDMSTQLDRKTWEFTMLTLFFEEVGLLDGRSRILSVGAGREAVIFWLAPRVGRMVATDTYGSGEFAASEAPERMLTDPGALSPYGEDLSNLEVASADARDLHAFADGSLDGVFTLSSIEHFGSPADIRRAAAEIGRVLRPGGYAYVVTELTLEAPPAWRRGAQGVARALSLGRLGRREVFTRAELQRDVIEPMGLELLQPLDTTISARSFDNLAVRRLGRWLRTPSGRFHPHIAIKVGGETFTSVGLPLRKPSRAPSA